MLYSEMNSEEDREGKIGKVGAGGAGGAMFGVAAHGGGRCGVLGCFLMRVQCKLAL
jgi:hypothetical protein